MVKITNSIILLFTLALWSNCSDDEGEFTSKTPQYEKSTIQYKSIADTENNLLSLDIYHFGQSSSKKPVVVYVHGGAFSLGDKVNNMTNKLNLFSSLGYILVSINYRLSPAVYSNDPNRLMYPSHNKDVADAVKWIFENIGNYGGDKQKVALIGHSAGAQLVALTGTSNKFLPARSIPLNNLKGIACIDTEGYDVDLQCRENNEVYLNAFGQADSFWQEASPISNIFPETNFPKFFVAKRGTNVRIGYANAFITKLKNNGVSVMEITVNQYDHEGINDAIGSPGETAITDPLKSFFAQCFQ